MKDRADLSRLDDNGNLDATTDYRSVYTSIAGDWWRVNNNPFLGSGFPPLKGMYSPV